MSSEKFVDMHMHSTFSDGVHAPVKLVEMAIRKGLSAICLSDHDIVDGFVELKPAAEAEGLEVMSGVELSCENEGRDCHMLGYGVSVTHERLQEMLRKFRDTREHRGIMIVEKLRDYGVNLDMDAILAKAGDGALGRPHIAEALLEGGHVSNIPEAFARYIGEDCPAYVDKYKMTPTEAVELIHEAGGVALLAHPGDNLQDPEGFEALLDLGVDGIEVHHPHHKPPVIKALLEIAERRDLLVSGGSDFHGFAGRENMGEPKVPYALFERVRDRLA